jgi:hypothetical protein
MIDDETNGVEANGKTENLPSQQLPHCGSSSPLNLKTTFP